MVHVLKGRTSEHDEGDAAPDRTSCRVSFEVGKSSPGPTRRTPAGQVRKSLVGAPGALLGAMAKGQKQSTVRQGTFSRMSIVGRGSVGPIKAIKDVFDQGRTSKEEQYGEDTAPPELTVLQQLTDNEFFGEDSLVSRHAASHILAASPTTRLATLYPLTTPVNTPLIGGPPRRVALVPRGRVHGPIRPAAR